jgi:Helitron helicase-like domain at N-terminus
MNPADTQNPIAQVFYKADIDLNHFNDTASPDNTQQSSNVTSDPFSSAKFFHFMIQTIIESSLKIKNVKMGFFSKEGIFGTVNAYICTVKAQRQGSLHLHLLVWLSRALTAKEMKEALGSAEFLEKVRIFI